jgi:small-conductance mechanosensitive channel
MEFLRTWFQRVKDFLDIPIFAVGAFELSLWTALYLVVLALLLVFLANRLRHWISGRLLARTQLDVGARQAIGSLVQYMVVLLGLLVVIQTAGIDLTTLNVLAGAIGLGVGFGLQNIANNFISGLILLVGRPIKVGDRIEVAGVEGDVMLISARSTTVVTNDNIAIIVPNSKLVSENVINWSHTDRKVRFKIPVSVAYGSDAREVERVLLEVARADPDVLEEPAPSVRFMEFGDSGLAFELRAWSSTLVHRKGLLISNLNFAIYDRFAEAGIEIPFPQRVVHLTEGERQKRRPRDGGEPDQ